MKDSSTKWVSVSHKRLPNLGDQICRPGLYFDLPISDNLDWRETPSRGNFLVGGGGLSKKVRKLGRPKNRVVIWGTGWVSRHFVVHPRPEGVELYGSRDWGQTDSDAWVPCASCMHLALSKPYETTREIVGYWNPDFLRPTLKGVPGLTNTVGEQEVFRWLGSAETVVTNSYHGAYWAVLLGKKVVIVNPYSSKFTHFHPSMQPPAVDAAEWQSAKPFVADGALEMCREANRKFYARVLEHMT